MLKKILTALALVLSLGLLAACEEPQSEGSAAETATTKVNYDSLVKSQPAEKMAYSPTRETKNFWIRTWDEKGKLAYVYLLTANGDTLGYYITEGLPVSYCTSLIPPSKIWKDQYGNMDIQNPSIDGTYSSASNCNIFYGKDATSGAYIEYNVGMGINALIFDQPMPRQKFAGAEPLGDATIAKVAKK